VGCANLLEYRAYLGSHILCSNCGDPNSLFFFFNYSHCEFQAIVWYIFVFTSLVLNNVYATLWSTGFCSQMTQRRHQTIMVITLFGGGGFPVAFVLLLLLEESALKIKFWCYADCAWN